MQKKPRTSQLGNAADLSYSPGLDSTADEAAAMPTSFAEWLAQPTCHIVDEPAVEEQGMFTDLLAESAAQNFPRPPVKPFEP